MQKTAKQDWVIKSKNNWLNIDFISAWEYKDLFVLFIKRDFVAFYKQTILGPLWFFLQPILTMFVFAFVFGKIGNISTNNLPKPLFYLPGIICWNYFAECILKNSTVFRDNANLFSKVYFPRIILPMSIVFSSMVRFFIQQFLFVIILIIYSFNGFKIHINTTILLLPILLILMAALGQGIGLIISSLTTKYRDLALLVNFGVQLLMFSTTVAYPLSAAPQNFKFWIALNPMTTILETFRYSFLGQGQFSVSALIYTSILTLVIFFLGIILFSKVEKDFIDTI
ncbi:MAG: ABC transporter permease [Bacteroidota bacterium]